MSCVLRASGRVFEPDEFLKASTLAPTRVWRRGDARASGARQRADVSTTSGMTISVSGADLAAFQQQIHDAIAFLRSNSVELARLVSFSGVEDVSLDFASAWNDEAVTHTDALPSELIRLAGQIGLGIEVSHYPVSDEGSAR